MSSQHQDHLVLIVIAGCVVLAVSGSLSDPASAAENVPPDTIVVTATRVPTPADEIGSSVTVISAEQIEQRQYRSLAEALRAVPGLRVVQSGGPGQQASVFIRGASSSHTLVLIDGVDASDPGSPSRAVDFANLPIDNVERIEIVRGPQSTLYGSNAIGGVINVITKRGSGDTRASLAMEAGSNSTANQYLTAQGGADRAGYSLSLSHQKTHSDSVTPERLREGRPEETDRYRNYSLSSRFDVELSDTVQLNLFGRFIDGTSGFDPEVGPFDPGSFSFATAEDPDAQLDSTQSFLRAETGVMLLDGRWDMTLAASYTHYERRTDNDRDDTARTLEEVSFFGENLDFSINNDFYLNDNHTLTFGAGTEKEDIDASGFREFPAPPFPPFVISEDTEADARTDYAYLQDQFVFGSRIYGTLGVRLDDYEDFDRETTWRATGVYKVMETDTRITASVGTGFRAPSLFELHGLSPNNFGSAYRGNPDLEPETSFGWDLGFEQPLVSDRLVVGATWFRNRIDDLIQLVTDPVTFDQTSENVDEVDIKGVEVFASATPIQSLKVQLSYTWQAIDQEDDSSDTEVVRRPKDKANLDIDYPLTKHVDLYLGVDHVGQRKDIIRAFDSAETIRLNSYTTANATVSYRPAEDWRLFGRIENLTDEHYEPADGFEAPGRWYVVGVQLDI